MRKKRFEIWLNIIRVIVYVSICIEILLSVVFILNGMDEEYLTTCTIIPISSVIYSILVLITIFYLLVIDIKWHK